MIIKKSPSKTLKNLLHELSDSKRTVLISIFLIFWSLLLFAMGDFYGETIKFVETKQSFKDLITFIKNPSYKGFFKTSKETVSFDIEFLDLQELNTRRTLALKNYSLKFIENDYINADMTYQGEKFPVKIKLKGSTASEHQLPKKWSFKVQLRGDSRFMGMQSFSLMDPKRRAYMMEWFYRAALKEEGIISKKYDFINVSINGSSLGLYAFDEEINKTLIERNLRRDGPIISLKDDSFWLDKAAWTLPSNKWSDSYLSAPFEIKNSKNNITTKQSQEAIDLLSAFRRGELSVSEVFDVEELAKYIAISDLLSAGHGFLPFNSVFYYNPIIHRLQPLPDDAYSEYMTNDLSFRYDGNSEGAYLTQIANDFGFAEAYLRELNRISKRSFVDNLLLKHSKEITEIYETFTADFVSQETVKIPSNIIYNNIRGLNEKLNPHVAVIANFEKLDIDGVTLKIATSTSLPIELISLTVDDEFILLPCKLDKKKCVRNIKGRMHQNVINYSEYEFFYPKLFDISLYPDLSENVGLLKVNYRILGSDVIRSDSILSYKAYDSLRITKDSKLMNPNYKEFNFLDFDEVGKIINIKQGVWRLEKDLIIPKNYTFSAGPNTTIDFINSAKILSYSPILFEGSKESPVNFISSNASSGSITVFANGKKSKLDNVVIDGLVNTSESTGAVTFYKSPVDIKNTRFINLKSEDALNIIKSSFSIADSIFSDNYSDSLDVDFGKGKIINSKFINSGNDSIDLSGSDVTISSVNIYNSGDKGISVGENSVTRIDHSEINFSKIGVAMKDSSSATINKVSIKDCDYAIALYQKKPDFGPANATIGLTKLERNLHDYIVEKDSTLMVDAIKIPGKFKNVYERLYENE